MWSRWREIVFVCLVLTLAALYVSRPQRGAHWDTTVGWWKSFLEVGTSRWEGRETEERFQQQTVIVGQLRYDLAGIAPLATFGEIAYMGCDIMVTLDDNAATHRWLVTYWRSSHLEDGAFSVHFRLVNPGSQTIIDETSSLTLNDEAAWAAVSFSEASLGGGQVWIKLLDSQGNPLPVASTLLVTEKGTDLLIWDRTHRE